MYFKCTHRSHFNSSFLFLEIINLFKLFNHLKVFPNCCYLVGRGPAYHTNPLAWGNLRGRNGLWEASWPHCTARPDPTSQLPTAFPGWDLPHQPAPRRTGSTGQVSACAHVSSSTTVHLTKTEKIHLGLQLLRDRKQLKNCTWPLSSAKRVLELHLLPRVFPQMRSESRSWHGTHGQGAFGLQRRDTCHGRGAPNGNTGTSSI